MNFQPYQQTTIEGCLPVCLLLLANGKVTEKEELDLTMVAIKRSDSYALQTLNAFTEQHNFKAKVYVDNPIFLKTLSTSFPNKNIELEQKDIDADLIQNTQFPYILYVDHQALGAYLHSPHFIIVEEKIDDETFRTFDPWFGESKQVEKSVLVKSVEGLRNYLKFCPLLILISAKK